MSRPLAATALAAGGERNGQRLCPADVRIPPFHSGHLQGHLREKPLLMSLQDALRFRLRILMCSLTKCSCTKEFRLGVFEIQERIRHGSLSLKEHLVFASLLRQYALQMAVAFSRNEANVWGQQERGSSCWGKSIIRAFPLES